MINLLLLSATCLFAMDERNELPGETKPQSPRDQADQPQQDHTRLVDEPLAPNQLRQRRGTSSDVGSNVLFRLVGRLGAMAGAASSARQETDRPSESSDSPKKELSKSTLLFQKAGKQVITMNRINKFLGELGRHRREQNKRSAQDALIEARAQLRPQENLQRMAPALLTICRETAYLARALNEYLIARMRARFSIQYADQYQPERPGGSRQGNIMVQARNDAHRGFRGICDMATRLGNDHLAPLFSMLIIQFIWYAAYKMAFDNILFEAFEWGLLLAPMLMYVAERLARRPPQ